MSLSSPTPSPITSASETSCAAEGGSGNCPKSVIPTETAYHAKYFAHALTLRGGENVDRIRQPLLNASVDLNPHQVQAALFALQSPLSKGVLLADEVGLGKTIEAGLVLCQLWAERRRSLLVICPAAAPQAMAVRAAGKIQSSGGGFGCPPCPRASARGHHGSVSAPAHSHYVLSLRGKDARKA